MKFLKKLLIVLAILLAIPLIIALFVKKDYAVNREITINKPKAQVFEYIKSLKNQNKFSVWASLDPNMKSTYTGTDGTVGFVSAWESPMDNVGAGEQEIKKITEGERIDYELRFIKPFESKSDAFMTTQALDSTNTKVAWGFTGKYDYPMNIMNVVIDMEKEIGKDFDNGLKNLKGILESGK